MPRLLLLLALSVAFASTLALGAKSSALPPVSATAANAARVRDRALAGESVAWDVLASLTTDIGARPTGSPAMTRARDWAVQRLTKLGFANVHVEEFPKKNAWQRGAESFSITFANGAATAQPLVAIGLGRSSPSPVGGVEGEVVVFPSVEALKSAAVGSLAGKVCVVNQPMVRTMSGEGYGPAVAARGLGPNLAEERGAVAYLTRSIATGEGRAPHTGGTGWGSAPAKIPAAALGVADADLLERLVAKGVVRVRVDMQSTVTPETPAYNIVGELRGRDPKAGVIVIGGHLDSWDVGQGAHDDGAGVAITVAAAKLIAELPPSQRPKRTVRVVLFGSEETGGSADAYAEAHKSEIASIHAALESDLGAGRVYRVALPKDAPQDPALAGLATVLAPLRAFIARAPAEHGGSDMEGLQDLGVPIVEVDPDATHYFDIHHSADDTLDKVNRADLDQATATWAALVYFLADSGVDLRKPNVPPPPPKP